MDDETKKELENIGTILKKWGIWEKPFGLTKKGWIEKLIRVKK